jgi:hypothetical protein
MEQGCGDGVPPTGDVLYHLFSLSFVSWLGPEKQGHSESVLLHFSAESLIPLLIFVLVDAHIVRRLGSLVFS